MVFFILASVIVVTASIVAFSRNIITSAFALLGTLAGTAAIYVFLHADFLAATQVLVYVGGILVLFLFAMLLTSNIDKVYVSNVSLNSIAAVPASLLMGGVLLSVCLSTDWGTRVEFLKNPTTRSIGHGFLSDYLLPFEVVSLILLAALLGAVMIVRREIGDTDSSSQED